jgi:hypothetical protein
VYRFGSKKHFKDFTILEFIHIYNLKEVGSELERVYGMFVLYSEGTIKVACSHTEFQKKKLINYSFIQEKKIQKVVSSTIFLCCFSIGAKAAPNQYLSRCMD